MTIFLTTQYLEEADELADRVGIINGGRLVAEGTPDELKRSVGNDVIVARVDGRAEAARLAVEPLARRAQRRGARRRDDHHGDRRRRDDRRRRRRPQHGVAPVRHLTLRTPTPRRRLPRATGNHIAVRSGTAPATQPGRMTARGTRPGGGRVDDQHQHHHSRRAVTGPRSRPAPLRRCVTSSPSPGGPCAPSRGSWSRSSRRSSSPCSSSSSTSAPCSTSPRATSRASTSRPSCCRRPS